LASVESNAFLSKKEYIHGGEDFYIGSSSAARQIAKRLIKKFSGKMIESSKLMGRKNGKEVYRLTFNIRVPEVQPGKFVRINNQIYLVTEVKPKRVGLLNLKSLKKQSMSNDKIEKVSILGGSELIFDAVVVIESNSEVQILNPDNMLTIDVIKPDGFVFEGETVKIFKHDEDIFLLPENAGND
jgi:nonsense-mediated mRNA decay protein 3